MRIPKELRIIANAIAAKGGIPYLVGGAVRDSLTEKPNKDLDVEVFGINAEALQKLLGKFGRVDAVGKSFGVLKLRTKQEEYDFSLPRRETKKGRGHKGFIIDVDPTMTLNEAVHRRDFTINALAYSLVDNCIVDLVGGQQDLKNGILRAVGPQFAEDPLRVLRGMQFAGRFNLTVDGQTAELCRSLLPEFPTLAKERVWIEWEKWALKSTHPSQGLRFLRQVGWDVIWPEFQNAEWAAMLDAVDAAVKAQENRLLVMLGALCYQLQGTSILANAPVKLTKQVAAMIDATNLPRISAEDIRRLSVALQPSNIRVFQEVLVASQEDVSSLRHHANGENLLDTPPKRLVTGKRLIERGITPGPAMGRLLKLAYDAQLSGEFATKAEAEHWLDRN